MSTLVQGWPGSVKGKPWTLSHYRRWEEQFVFEDGERHPAEGWQLDFVRDVLRGYTENWLVVPEGNSKTTQISKIVLYHLDNTMWPWVPVGASSRDQAEILFGQAEGFVDRTPTCWCDPIQLNEGVCDTCGQPGFKWDRWTAPRSPFKMTGTRQIKHAHNGGRGLKVYASDVETADGVIPTLFAVDEGHRLKDLGQYRTWVGKCEKRGGQGIMISTAGVPGGDFEETRRKMRQAAVKVTRRGRSFARYEGADSVLHEYCVPSISHVRDIEYVKAANPLRKITKGSLASKLARASLDFGEDWLRKTCNIAARSSKAGVSELDWERAGSIYHGDPEEAVVGDHLEIPAGVPVIVGADFAWSLDTTALTPLWVPSPTFRLAGQARILIPPRDGSLLDPLVVKDAFWQIHKRNPILAVIADKTKAEDTLLWVESGDDEFSPHAIVVDRTQSNEHAVMDYNKFGDALRGGALPDEDYEDRAPWLRHDGGSTTMVYENGEWTSGNQEVRTQVMNAIARKLPGDRYRFDRQTASRAAALEDFRVIDVLTALGFANTVASTGWEPEQATPLVAMVSR